MFAISNSSGDVIVVGPVDRELHSQCSLTLVAVDITRPASLSAYSRMRITVRDVNDNPPRLTLTTLSPPGGRRAEVRAGALPGAFVAHVAVADPDTGNSSVVDCSVNSTNFRLTPLDGGDFQLTTAVTFRRRHDPVYVIAVTCTDRGLPPLSDFRSLNVVVVDVGPRFPAETVSARVPAGIVPGTPVVRLNATGSDTGPEAEIVYSMSLVTGRVDALKVDATSGWVSTKIHIGRDAINTTFTYTVTATDRGTPPMSAVATLHVHVIDTGYDVITGSSTTSSTFSPLPVSTGGLSTPGWPAVSFSNTVQSSSSSSTFLPPPLTSRAASPTHHAASPTHAGSTSGVSSILRSDVIIAAVVCATVIVVAIIVVVAVVFCVRRHWKDRSYDSRLGSGQ